MHFARKIVASEAHEFGDLRCFLPFFNRALSCRPVSSFPKNIPGHLLSGGHLTIVPLDEISLGQSVHSHLQPGPRDRWGGSFNRSGLVVHWGVAPLDEKMKNLCGAWCGYIWYMIVCIYIKLYYILLYYIYILLYYMEIYIYMYDYICMICTQCTVKLWQTWYQVVCKNPATGSNRPICSIQLNGSHAPQLAGQGSRFYKLYPHVFEYVGPVLFPPVFSFPPYLLCRIFVSSIYLYLHVMNDVPFLFVRERRFEAEEW